MSAREQGGDEPPPHITGSTGDENVAGDWHRARSYRFRRTEHNRLAGGEIRTQLESMSQMSRRDLLRAGVCAGLSLPALPRIVLADWRRGMRRGLTERPYLDAALRAE